MTDITPDHHHSVHGRRALGLEYGVYFACIFAVALPGAALGWGRALLAGDRAQLRRGVFARAWRQAQAITPVIFSA